MKILDLFSGAGGAGMGYTQAGFDVTGVDIKARRCGYPAGTFIKTDCLDVMQDKDFLASFDAIHASPPCQTHSRTKHLRDAQGNSTRHVDLVPETRAALEASGLPFVIENVPGTPLREDLMLCGSMFNLEVDGRQLRRHRIFESNIPLSPPRPCRHEGKPLGVYGSKGDSIPCGGQTCSTLDEARLLMGIEWMSWAAIVESIPPVYTKWIGKQLLEALL